MENEVKYYNVHIKKCIYNYLEKNRDKINEQRRANYKKRCENSPEYVEKLRMNARKHYQKKKVMMVCQTDEVN